MVVKKIFILILLVSLIAQASALTIDITMKDEFSINDKISFTYTISSEEDLEINYYARVDCPYAPVPEFGKKQAEIRANQPLAETYTYHLLNKDVESQTCKAVVAILEPEEIVKEKEFLIIGEKGFSFSLDFEKKIFVLNEEIKIDYESDIAPEITANLIYPDGTREEINLPAEIKALQVGTYEIEVTARKEGYKTITKKEQFAVITKETSISEISVCKIDGKCSGEENYQNCPQDCASVASVKPGAYNLDRRKENIIYLTIVFVLSALIVGLIVLIVRFRKLKLTK